VCSSDLRFGFGARLALMVLGAIALILLVSWVWHSKWPDTIKKKTEQIVLQSTQRLGFSVEDVIVEGRRNTSRASLFETLKVHAGSPIFQFDPHETHAAIMALPWTESVTVIRSLPNKIVIKLKERQPIARWKNQEKTIVIDAQGQELTAAVPEQFASLPLVVGNAAPEQTQSLLSLLHEYPVVSRVLKAAVRVGERRWNLYLHPNLLIRLPELQTHVALEKLTKLIEEQKVLDRNVVAVDLRFPDRMVIEPGQQPAEPVYGESDE